MDKIRTKIYTNGLRNKFVMDVSLPFFLRAGDYINIHDWGDELVKISSYDIASKINYVRLNTTSEEYPEYGSNEYFELKGYK